MQPLPPKAPPNPERPRQVLEGERSRPRARSGDAWRSLLRHVLRGGFLGFGPLVLGLLLAAAALFGGRAPQWSWVPALLPLYVLGSLAYGWWRWLFTGPRQGPGLPEPRGRRWVRRALASLLALPFAAFGLTGTGAGVG